MKNAVLILVVVVLHVFSVFGKSFFGRESQKSVEPPPESSPEDAIKEKCRAMNAKDYKALSDVFSDDCPSKDSTIHFHFNNRLRYPKLEIHLLDSQTIMEGDEVAHVLCVICGIDLDSGRTGFMNNIYVYEDHMILVDGKWKTTDTLVLKYIYPHLTSQQSAEYQLKRMGLDANLSVAYRLKS